jgi:ABC-type transport system involved in cytochrome c biogenesis permease subunit
MEHHLAYLTLLLYAASFLCYVRILYSPHVGLGRLATLLLAGGIVAQYFALLERSRWVHSVPYNDLYGSMSLFAWLLGVTYLGLEIFHRQRSVGPFVTLLLVAWMALLGLITRNEPLMPPPARGSLFAFHVTLNTWAYSAFALSFVLSLIYLVQNRLLRSRRVGTPFWRVPALDDIDLISRSSVYVGLVALCLGAIMGLVWRHRLTGGYSWGDPKVIITLLILAVYIAYLCLSRTAKWRGARAAFLCALNFVLVMFSYTLVNLYFTKFHRFF